MQRTYQIAGGEGRIDHAPIDDRYRQVHPGAPVGAGVEPDRTCCGLIGGLVDHPSEMLDEQPPILDLLGGQAPTRLVDQSAQSADVVGVHSFSRTRVGQERDARICAQRLQVGDLFRSDHRGSVLGDAGGGRCGLWNGHGVSRLTDIEARSRGSMSVDEVSLNPHREGTCAGSGSAGTC